MKIKIKLYSLMKIMLKVIVLFFLNFLHPQIHFRLSFLHSWFAIWTTWIWAISSEVLWVYCHNRRFFWMSMLKCDFTSLICIFALFLRSISQRLGMLLVLLSPPFSISSVSPLSVFCLITLLKFVIFHHLSTWVK